MSTHIPFITRLDASGGGAAVFDDSLVGEARVDSAGKVVGYSGLGDNVGRSSKIARARLIPVFQRRWPKATEKQCQDAADQFIAKKLAPMVANRVDAATDFTSSGLELQGGAAEMIVRPPDPTLFVPGPGRTVALQSRNVLKPGYRTNSYRIRERKGQAQWVEPNATRELSNVDYSDEKEIRGASYYGAKWSWNIPDSWEAAILGDDQEGELQAAATDALDDFRERASWWGSVDKKLSGVATLDGAMILLAGQQFSSMVPTAVQMMQRIAAMEMRFMLGNKGRRPTHAIIPHADRLAMQNTYFGTGGEGPSVWDRAKEQYPWIAMAMFSDNLSLANEAGNATRWIIYIADPKNFYIEHMDTMIFGPFEDYMNHTYILLRRHGGAIAKLPEQTLYADFTA